MTYSTQCVGAGLLACATTLASAAPADAYTMSILHSFCAACTYDGQTPNQLIIAPDGTLYGTTSDGGKHAKGSVFELVPNGGSWTYKMIHSFCAQKKCRDGDSPTSLFIDADGNLYGTTKYGGKSFNDDGEGLVFELKPNVDHSSWHIATLYEFGNKGLCDTGCFPNALTYAGAQSGMPYDGASPLYGTTISGGGHAAGGGVVFQLTSGRTWREKIVYLFCSEWDGTDCVDGNGPDGIAADTFGNIFGVTVGGGLKKNKYAGTAFQLSSAGRKWTHTILYDFCAVDHCTDGANPVGVVLDPAGKLVGTAAGGVNGIGQTAGVIYQLTPNGSQSQYAVKYNFCSESDCADGDNPGAPVVFDGTGNIYGTTRNGGGHDIDKDRQGGGVVFQFGSSEQVMYSFCALDHCEDGEYPSQVVLDGHGNLFGITYTGGANRTGGIVFEISP